MSTIINFAIIIAIASLLIFGRLLFDMQRARRRAIEALTNLDIELKQAKLELSRVSNLTEIPQVDSYLEFLVKANVTNIELRNRRSDLISEEKKVGYFKRFSLNEREWLKLAQQADLNCELVTTNAKSFKLAARM